MSTETPEREARRLRKALQKLINEVSCCLASIDQSMQGPSTNERGQKIGQACSVLAYARDSAAHFDLGQEFTVVKRNIAKAVKRRIEAQ